MADGGRVIERLAASLGDAADIQIDIFWAVVGGADPAEVIRSLGPRVVSLHLKDGVDLPPSAYGDTPFVNVPVGTGVVRAGGRRSRERRLGRLADLEFDHVDGSPIDATRASLEHLVERGLGQASRVTGGRRRASASSAVAMSRACTCPVAPRSPR